MRRAMPLALCVGALALLPVVARSSSPSSSPSKDEQGSIVITLKDGRHQTFALANVTKIEFKTAAGVSEVALPSTAPVPPKDANAFIGKWRVGEGVSPIIDSHFIITLYRDGRAERTLGDGKGTWTVVNGQAQITWEDGWRDAIRKSGHTFEKVAFSPGHTFTDAPNNVARAEKVESEPI